VAALTFARPYACLRFRGDAEYETIRAVKQAVRIPVVANGDVDSPQKARRVLDVTGADAVMIGRAAQGRPWIFREVTHFFATGSVLPPPRVEEVRELLLSHLGGRTFLLAPIGAHGAQAHHLVHARSHRRA
jgi:tRNA-dihydrouridine synthase